MTGLAIAMEVGKAKPKRSRSFGQPGCGAAVGAAALRPYRLHSRGAAVRGWLNAACRSDAAGGSGAASCHGAARRCGRARPARGIVADADAQVRKQRGGVGAFACAVRTGILRRELNDGFVERAIEC